MIKKHIYIRILQNQLQIPFGALSVPAKPTYCYQSHIRIIIFGRTTSRLTVVHHLSSEIPTSASLLSQQDVI